MWKKISLWDDDGRLTTTYLMFFFLSLFLILIQIGRRVDDLFEDLRDGHNLVSLLEVLSGDHLVRK